MFTNCGCYILPIVWWRHEITKGPVITLVNRSICTTNIHTDDVCVLYWPSSGYGAGEVSVGVVGGVKHSRQYTIS